ncbi:MAG: Flp pilus assembly protein CpaB [Candidatus Dormibacteria bacterium]
MSTTSPRRRRPMQILVGLVLMVLAFVGVVVVARLAGPPAQKLTVVGAARDIHVGRAITADDLTTVQVDAPGPTGAVHDKATVLGRLARTNITAGAPLLDTALASVSAVAPAKLFFTIPANKVALNIPAGDISPYVQPGDQIDVIATPKTAASSVGQQTKATVKGLLVLAVGSPGQAAQGAATTTGGNLVVEVSLQDAEALQFIVKNTDFTYVLKSPQDSSAPDPTTSGMDLGQFKALYGFK